MNQDNVKLALWISGIWGGLIILIVGTEAIVHDGAIATTIVDTFSKVLFGLGAILAVVTGASKYFETKLASHGVVPAGSAVMPPLADVAVAAQPAAPAEPVSTPGGLAATVVSAVVGEGV